ncbi:hypothetical protein CAOG_02902 [Capsaspora owczarzaki ATCC 30864]|uniref:IMD domain-containing protein n=1 Tax=Capsaspora owczarzaki (strain ATCC 30864) TaxID=595528 RepID=A0A0D2WM32_CAPO3|nr:hypothetical protein CAOG_02902 [Capsaspora owczarzaki ATCC 30864]KJE91820.1 hypothetical protein CAOG_002902 [Capsaspora owczarzaki ATCC 30864]|eukprot:XP_004363741.1 hypothetical protein CAOG_02902 [Capsaspora owczarzaki ATCC 30864]
MVAANATPYLRVIGDVLVNIRAAQTDQEHLLQAAVAYQSALDGLSKSGAAFAEAVQMVSRRAQTSQSGNLRELAAGLSEYADAMRGAEQLRLRLASSILSDFIQPVAVSIETYQKNVTRMERTFEKQSEQLEGEIDKAVKASKRMTQELQKGKQKNGAALRSAIDKVTEKKRDFESYLSTAIRGFLEEEGRQYTDLVAQLSTFTLHDGACARKRLTFEGIMQRCVMISRNPFDNLSIHGTLANEMARHGIVMPALSSQPYQPPRVSGSAVASSPTPMSLPPPRASIAATGIGMGMRHSASASHAAASSPTPQLARFVSANQSSPIAAPPKPPSPTSSTTLLASNTTTAPTLRTSPSQPISVPRMMHKSGSSSELQNQTPSEKAAARADAEERATADSEEAEGGDAMGATRAFKQSPTGLNRSRSVDHTNMKSNRYSIAGTGALSISGSKDALKMTENHALESVEQLTKIRQEEKAHARAALLSTSQELLHQLQQQQHLQELQQQQHLQELQQQQQQQQEQAQQQADDDLNRPLVFLQARSPVAETDSLRPLSPTVHVAKYGSVERLAGPQHTQSTTVVSQALHVDMGVKMPTATYVSGVRHGEASGAIASPVQIGSFKLEVESELARISSVRSGSPESSKQPAPAAAAAKTSYLSLPKSSTFIRPARSMDTLTALRRQAEGDNSSESDSSASASTSASREDVQPRALTDGSRSPNEDASGEQTQLSRNSMFRAKTLRRNNTTKGRLVSGPVVANDPSETSAPARVAESEPSTPNEARAPRPAPVFSWRQESNIFNLQAAAAAAAAAADSSRALDDDPASANARAAEAATQAHLSRKRSKKDKKKLAADGDANGSDESAKTKIFALLARRRKSVV